MTKNELVREVAVSEKLLLSTATQAVDGIIRVIKQTLAKGEPVIIRGFGTFQPYQCNERPARNFKSGKPCVIPEHRSAKFRISKDLVKCLNTEAGKEAAV